MLAAYNIQERTNCSKRTRNYPTGYWSVSKVVVSVFSCAIFVAGRSHCNFCDPSHVPPHTQPTREHWMHPRAALLHMAGRKLPSTTALNRGARAQYSRRYPAAYGHQRDHHVRTSTTSSPTLCTAGPNRPGLPFTATFRYRDDQRQYPQPPYSIAIPAGRSDTVGHRDPRRSTQH